MGFALEKQFPALTYWVKRHGWIEMGDDGRSSSFMRACDEGALVWESSKRYRSLDEAFMDLEKALKVYIEQELREVV